MLSRTFLPRLFRLLPAVALLGAAGISQAQSIKIGLPVPLTGPYGAEAQDQVRNAELAVKEFNGAGGLAGRKAELLVRDDRLNPGEAATRALELIEKDGANFIVGGLSAATQLSINNVTKQRKTLYISISQSDAINEATDASPYTFHEALNPHMTTQAVGRYAFKSGTKVAFLTADYAYGHEMTRGFTAVAKQLGAVVVGEVKHPLGASDYSAFLPRIRAMNPDVLVFNNFGADNRISIKQAGDFGMKKQMQFVTPIMTYTARVSGGASTYEGVIDLPPLTVPTDWRSPGLKVNRSFVFAHCQQHRQRAGGAAGQIVPAGCVPDCCAA
ncbi:MULTISPECIES: ABC transporter substrate-binding protein [Pigmentiphaga]|uniref:Leucine-binding protein domain-containing protein n=1 Tax=Pigmentiphaga daeguensis TaxID=414049 RepID=A0ABN1D425_9BURK|nr:ABC transporter substrate-binding protein [Pigmentiphaga sp. NML030171]